MAVTIQFEAGHEWTAFNLKRWYEILPIAAAAADL
jgi:hypothetical protein